MNTRFPFLVYRSILGILLLLGGICIAIYAFIWDNITKNIVGKTLPETSSHENIMDSGFDQQISDEQTAKNKKVLS